MKRLLGSFIPTACILSALLLFSLSANAQILVATQSQVNATCNGGCNGSATVVASGGMPPYSYSWSPAGGMGATASSLCAGNYTVTITDLDFEVITKSFTITQPAAIATPTASSNSPVCTGNTINLSTPAVAGATYSWTGPSSFTSSVQNPSRTTATVAMAGTYNIRVTVGGCTSAAGTVAVVVNATPATPTASSNSPVCTGNTINLSTPAVAGATYSWTGPSSFSSSVQNPSRTTATVAMAGTYSITKTTTGCTSAAGTVAVVVNATPATPTASSNSPVCTGNTINLSTPAVAGATYSWTGPSSFSSSVQNPSRTNATTAMAGTYNLSVTTTGCTSGVGTVAVVVSSAISTTTASQINVTCYGASNGSASVTPSGGISPYTYSWSPSGGIAPTASNLAAGSYTVTVTDAAACTATGSYTITQPANTPGSNDYTLPASNQTVVRNVSNANFVAGNCELVNAVVPSGASPVSGSVTNKVWIEGTVPSQSGSPFVQRHYEITPASNASTATGTVTLYFTQTEFDNYNADAGSMLNLPANPTDNGGKANLRIGKYSGTSGDGTGLPVSYSGGTTIINPDDNDIVWNAVSLAWEVTFPVAGFSGFIVQTNLFTLPVTWVSFTAAGQGQSVLLKWSTASEQNTKDFIVQHSIDGAGWNTAAILAAAGNSSSLLDYSYIHNNAVRGYNYYRIMQTDLDGNTSYSATRVVNLSDDHAAFTIAGNKISNGVLQVQVNQTIIISFYEINGKLLWKKRFSAGMQSIDVSSYVKGIYLVNADGKTEKIIIQ